MGDLARKIIDAAQTGLIDAALKSEEMLRPKLLYNDVHMGSTVLANLERELESCNSFWMSVAFITSSGLIVLKNVLRKLEEKGIPGKILTTDYLYFSEPKALRELLRFSNLKVHLYSKEDFHIKGYMFQKEKRLTFIVGSSNLTQSALKSNKEWNIKLSSLKEGELIKETNTEFLHMWKNAEVLSEEWIKYIYEPIYYKKKLLRSQQKNEHIRTNLLEPNKMQSDALKSLAGLRKKKEKKALLISATGTGKTYLSAFDVRNFKPGKMLFLVHRELILQQALQSFKNVLGESIQAGILSGNSREYQADYLFSTVQTMSKDDILHQYERTYFDYIIIDETHKAGAKTYQKIMDYFNPQFLLGMTATPERTDGYDIFKLFDHNIAYEIRLHHAMKEKLLCPFHYFGISELQVNGKILDEQTDFRYLISEQRVKHIVEQAEFYGYSGDRLRGLVFCSKNTEAKELALLFQEKGYNTVALLGSHGPREREEAIARLEQKKREGGLDYIFTVDIFNEGVDIPSVNQIIMLRPTQSAIVFVQQLGRGLRKFEEKDYLVVLDFIGNYQKNFLIPVALSGDRTYNKDTIRRYLVEGNRMIPGCSTIHFDEITKKQIYASIDMANFNDIRFIKENYMRLKHKLGRIPTLNDFDKYGEMDIVRIFENNSLGSYYKFLSKYEKEYKVRLDEKQEKCIEFISKKLASGKRVHELEAIKRLLKYQHRLFEYLTLELDKKYKIKITDRSKTNLINVLTNEFATGAMKKIYKDCILISSEGDDYGISEEFFVMLQNPDFYQIVAETVEFGLSRYQKYYGNLYMNTNFQLYSKYTYEDVCRLLEWERGEVALNIGGYKYDKKTKTYPIFINYDKAKDIKHTVRYEDRFLSPSVLIAISKSGRTLSSEDVFTAMHARELNVEMELFVRKNKDDKISKEFYYLGKINATGQAHEFIMPNTTKSAVEIEYELVTPVREDLYEYIVNEGEDFSEEG